MTPARINLQINERIKARQATRQGNAILHSTFDWNLEKIIKVARNWMNDGANERVNESNMEIHMIDLSNTVWVGKKSITNCQLFQLFSDFEMGLTEFMNTNN